MQRIIPATACDHCQANRFIHGTIQKSFVQLSVYKLKMQKPCAHFPPTKDELKCFSLTPQAPLFFSTQLHTHPREQKSGLQIFSLLTTSLFFSSRAETEKGLSRKHIIEGLKGSLDRLQMEYVDIVFANKPDPHTPMEGKQLV